MASEETEPQNRPPRTWQPQPPGAWERVSRQSPDLRGGVGIASALLSAISRMDSAAKVRESLALAYWPRVVGAQGAAATEADSVRDGILIVRTKSSTWSHELTLHKARLLLGLNRLLGGKIITDIYFRAQGVEEKTEADDPETPTSEELDAIVLEPAEKDELRARLQALFYSVEDDHVRRTIAARLTTEAKLRHWRLERGWHVCPRCYAVHKTDYRLCPICRLSP